MKRVFLLYLVGMMLLLFLMSSCEDSCWAEEMKTMYKKVVIPKVGVNLRTGPASHYPRISWHPKAVLGDTFDFFATKTEPGWVPFVAGWEGNRVIPGFVSQRLTKIEVVKVEIPIKSKIKVGRASAIVGVIDRIAQKINRPRSHVIVILVVAGFVIIGMSLDFFTRWWLKKRRKKKEKRKKKKIGGNK